MSLVALTSWSSKIWGPHSPVSSILGLHNPTPGTPGLPNSRSQHPPALQNPTSSLHVPNLLGPRTPQKQAAPSQVAEETPRRWERAPPIPNPHQGLPAPLCPLLSPCGDASGGWGGAPHPALAPAQGLVPRRGGATLPVPPTCPCLSAGA